MTAESHDRVAVPKRGRVAGRVDDLTLHLFDPLFRHAYTLIVNTGLSSGLGVLYWILVGRLYSPADVGRNAAVISSVTFLVSVAQLNLRPVLGRFVPVAGRASGRLVLAAYTSASVVAAGGAALFLLTSDLWAAEGPITALRDSLPAAGLFMAAAAIWTVFVLQDGVLIGLRATVLVTVENVGFGIVKILVVVGLAVWFTPPEFAIAISWLLPMLLVVVAINLLLFSRLLPIHVREHPETEQFVSVRRVFRFAAGDYLGSLFALSYIALLPVIVIGQAGPVTAAHFYIVWVITSSLQVLPGLMVLSLVVDTATDPSMFRAQGRRMLLGMARVLLPICIATFVAAPWILQVFGPTYEDSTLLLRLLALSVIPYSINLLYVGRARLRVNASRIVAVQAIIAVLVLGLTVILVPIFGVDGVGVACLVGQGAVAAVLLGTALRPLLTEPRFEAATSQPDDSDTTFAG